MQNINSIEDIFDRVQVIFQVVLEDNDIVLRNETTSNDIPEWDSLNHISLVVNIEKQFKIQFTAKEIQDFKNVGEMCQGIFEKIK